MNVNISVFVICVEAVIYLLLYNLHDCTFKKSNFKQKISTRVNRKRSKVHETYFTF